MTAPARTPRAARANRTRRRNRLAPAAVVVAGLGLGGCSEVVMGTLTLGDVSNIAGLASTLTTGKGLPEHLVSFIMGKDCRFMEGIMREDRKICEEPGAPGTDKDFKGVIVLLFGDDEVLPPDARTLYAANVKPDSLSVLAETSVRPSLARPLRRTAQRGPVKVLPDDLVDSFTIAEASMKAAKSVSMTRLERRQPKPAITATARFSKTLPVSLEGPSLSRVTGRRARAAMELSQARESADTLDTVLTESVPEVRETRVIHAGELAPHLWSRTPGTEIREADISETGTSARLTLDK